MNSDLHLVALREITETRRLVEALITGDGSFDYFGAKLVVQALQQKVKRLAKLQAEAASAAAAAPNVVPFEVPPSIA